MQNPLPLVGNLGKLALGGLLTGGTMYGLDRLFGGGEQQKANDPLRQLSEQEYQNTVEYRRRAQEAQIEAEKARWAREAANRTAGATEAQTAAILEELRGDRALREKIALANLDPRLYAQRAAVDQANWERSQELNRIAGMEQTRELTRRQIENSVIAAWQGITEAQLKADAMIAQGMMNLAYTAGMPNPNVLQAGANFAQQGAAAFTAPRSTIS
jgi:hypothetical protein